MSPDTFRLTEAFARTDSRAYLAFHVPFTDPVSTAVLRNTCALWLTISFPLTGRDRPDMEKSGSKVQNLSCSSFVTALRGLYHYDEHIYGRRVMPCGVQNEDITHIHKSFTLCSHNVPTWTQHAAAAAATLNIFLIHIEIPNGN